MIEGRDAAARITVVVASRDRPGELLRCLSALDHVIWPQVEVVVVADKIGRDAVAGLADIHVVACDQPNLALARNVGIRAAGGDIIAFIDDDAVAEPIWLAAIADAFRDGAVGAVTGPVLGRNGISLQSGAQKILSDATTEQVSGGASIRRARAGRAPKTVGTNMAFRARLLREAGGFDETFAFYLEDSDLNMRLGAMGLVTAYAPLAVVHHATAASPRRRADRAPRDLTEIGYSTAAFLRRYSARVDEALAEARDREWVRAIRGLQSGALEPRDVARLMAGFDAAAKEGVRADRRQLAEFGVPPEFRPRPPRVATHAIVATGLRGRRQAHAKVAEMRGQGATVSLFQFSPGTLYHSVRYDDGVWRQSGGLFGRSDRVEPLIRFTTLRKRLQAEADRVADLRGFGASSAALFPEGSPISTQWFPFF